LDNFIKVFVRCRLAVARECDIVEAPQGLRHIMELGRLVDRAGRYQLQRRAQLFQQSLYLDEAGFTLRTAIYLAVDAIEVANLVGIEIDAHRNATRPPAKHGVYEAVVLEKPSVVGM
jgi:hypothetical protein